MEQSIFSHVYPNGLVLVAEEMQSVESAAFTFRVPAGCVYEPANRGGLAGLTCEMALRGAGSRDNRQFINDLDNLGVERGESVSDAHTSYSGATLAKNLLPTLAIYADLLQAAALARGSARGRPADGPARAERRRRRAGPKGDARAAAAALSRALGPAQPGQRSGA